MHDLRFALRAFVRTPATSALIVITLAVAIATTAIVASTVEMVWRFIPAVRTERLVFVASTDPRPEQSRSGMADGLARSGVSIPDLVDWSARTNSFEAFAAFTFQSAVLTGLDVPSRITTVQTTRNLLDLWGVTPRMGRTFAAGEDTPGRDGVVVVSDAFWRNHLSAAQDAVGKVVTLRTGFNDQVCVADNPKVEGFNVACYHRDLEPFMARGRELTAQGITEDKDRDGTRWKEIDAGTLAMPKETRTLAVTTGKAFDATTGQVVDAYTRWVLYVPHATGASTGLPTTAAPGVPWLMDPGTAGAHIMISPTRPVAPPRQ